MPHASREAMTRNKPDDMPWLINGALTSMTFRRLAHAEGRYRTSLAEAKSRGYPTPPTSDPTSQTTERDHTSRCGLGPRSQPKRHGRGAPTVAPLPRFRM